MAFSRMDKNPPDKQGSSNAPPVFKTKCGRVHVAVFEQETANGPMLSITLKRTYKTDAGFKDAYSFALGDVDDISRALTDVKAWAKERRQE